MDYGELELVCNSDVYKETLIFYWIFLPEVWSGWAMWLKWKVLDWQRIF
jgi:hypothetical protein